MDSFRVVMCNVLERKKRGSKVLERTRVEFEDLCIRLNTDLLLPAMEN